MDDFSTFFGPLGIGPLGVLVLVIAVAWCVLMLFAPFFWYGAWYRAKQAHLELEKIRSVVEQVTGKKAQLSDASDNDLLGI